MFGKHNLLGQKFTSSGIRNLQLLQYFQQYNTSPHKKPNQCYITVIYTVDIFDTDDNIHINFLLCILTQKFLRLRQTPAKTTFMPLH
jgi:hypothetical protein